MWERDLISTFWEGLSNGGTGRIFFGMDIRSNWLHTQGSLLSFHLKKKIMRFTYLTRDHSEFLVDRYSERLGGN